MSDNRRQFLRLVAAAGAVVPLSESVALASASHSSPQEMPDPFLNPYPPGGRPKENTANSASATRRPERSETSRSWLRPPASTMTFLMSESSLQRGRG